MSDIANTSLDGIASDAEAAGRLALDTEFMGEGRYRTLLCLIQLAVTAGLEHPGHTTPVRSTPSHPNSVRPDPVHPNSAQPERIELIDPLAQDLDGAPLARVLADPAVQIVVHAGRQDVALIRRRFATDVQNVFDTQVAAGFAGLGAQCSYDTLLAEILGIRVAKSASFTRWDARPLSPEQLAYAREDVVHLLELAAELERRLAALGRLEWAREECRFLEQVSDERNLDSVFARLPRIRGLSASSQTIARELVEWREHTAAGADRPVQSILSDVALVELAKRKPSSTRQLEQIRGVGAASLHRRARELLDAVRRGSERPPEMLQNESRPPAPAPDDGPLIALAEALVRARAREAGLAYELLAARADLQAIVAGLRVGSEEADVRTLRGWRRELVGAELLELLDGRVSLSVSDRAIRVVTN